MENDILDGQSGTDTENQNGNLQSGTVEISADTKKELTADELKNALEKARKEAGDYRIKHKTTADTLKKLETEKADLEKSLAELETTKKSLAELTAEKEILALKANAFDELELKKKNDLLSKFPKDMLSKIENLDFETLELFAENFNFNTINSLGNQQPAENPKSADTEKPVPFGKKYLPILEKMRNIPRF